MLAGNDLSVHEPFDQRAVGRANLVRAGGKSAAQHDHNVGVDSCKRRWQHNLSDLIGSILPGNVEKINGVKLILFQRCQSFRANILADQAWIEHFVVIRTKRNLCHYESFSLSFLCGDWPRQTVTAAFTALRTSSMSG